MSDRPTINDALKARLGRSSKEELSKMFLQMKELEKRLAMSGPKDDDELHAWIKMNVGVDIPRVKVCPDHVAPFTFIADLYFERSTSAIAMANRGGSKTYMAAVLHFLNARFKPGIEAATVGAIEAQSRRAYAHLQKIVMQAKAQDDIDKEILSETRWKNGSRVEVLPGTKSAVNGPHPQVVHADEVELMDPDVFAESRNMAQSITKDGVTYKAIDLITSTRKRGFGPMQQLIDEIDEAERQGFKPPYDLYAWCIFETASEVPNCRGISQAEREKRLTQLGRPLDDLCPCNEIPGGKWENGTNRTLETVCQGRLFKSRGWMPYSDVMDKFRKNGRAVWEAQQECSRPSLEGLVMPQFTRDRFGIRKFVPDMANGPIYMAIDFGGTNPHAVIWVQRLMYDLEVEGVHSAKRILKEGTHVLFDEIYHAEGGNMKIAKMIVDRENWWRQRVRGFRTVRRFYDPQAKAAMLDFARHDPPLQLVFMSTRDVKEHIKDCAERLDADLFAVAVDRAAMFCDELESWHYPKKRAGMQDDPEIPVNDFDHTLAAWRYLTANVKVVEHAMSRTGRMKPTSGTRKHEAAKGPISGVSVMPRDGLPRTERWRRSLGGPSQNPGLMR
jgi:hypothetical protein